MRLHILPALGRYRLADLTPELIVGLYARCEGQLGKAALMGPPA
jgi:hypothetical protein